MKARTGPLAVILNLLLFTLDSVAAPSSEQTTDYRVLIEYHLGEPKHDSYYISVPKPKTRADLEAIVCGLIRDFHAVFSEASSVTFSLFFDLDPADFHPLDVPLEYEGDARLKLTRERRFAHYGWSRRFGGTLQVVKRFRRQLGRDADFIYERDCPVTDPGP